MIFSPCKFQAFSVTRQIFNNETKGQILKLRQQEKQSMPIFPKKEHFLPSDRHTYAHWARNLHFSEKMACLAFLLPPF